MTKTKKLAYCAFMIALALVLSYAERFIPLQLVVPLPGIKLGLANIVTLSVLYLMGPKEAFAVLLLRCVLGSFFAGGISSLLFSLGGALLSMAVMALVRKCSLFSVYGVSVLGAAAHNIGQVTVAVLLMQTVGVFGYLPYLLGISVLTGLLTGAAASAIFRLLAKTKEISLDKKQ